MKRDNLVVTICSVVFLFALIMIMSQGIRSTGYATTATTISNVSITSYFAIAMSENLSDGIQFGSISTLPATSINATHNFDGANSTADSGSETGTSMWMNVSDDSNTRVTFCINASTHLTSSGADTILIGNETYYNSTWTNSSDPGVGDEVSLTTGYVDSGYNISVGGNNYYRFWLDVPAAQPTGTYNNTVGFKGVSAGTGC